MGFSRHEYWSGLPRPTPGNHPDPGIQPVFLTLPALAGEIFTTTATTLVLKANSLALPCGT